MYFVAERGGRGRGRGKQWRDRIPTPVDNGATGAASENQVITDYGIEEWRDSGKNQLVFYIHVLNFIILSNNWMFLLTF